MKVEYLKNEESEAEIKLDNLTIAEVLRAYLAKDSKIDFVAWRRKHPSEDPVLKIKSGKGRTVKKAIEIAVKQINKEADKLVKDLKGK